MIRAALYTLGCKLNQVESEAIADAFRREGFLSVSPAEAADIYIVNTCTVTTKAEQKARRMIRKFASSPGSPLVVVTGCYAELDPELLEKTAHRLIILPLAKKASLVRMPAYLSARMEEGLSIEESIRSFIFDPLTDEGVSPFDFQPELFSFHARAFLKIEDGCDNTCSYCRVRIARGRAVSLDVQSVLSRARALEERGYREIVLTGVNISAYRDGQSELPGLIVKLDSVLKEARIRLSSIEPDMISPAMLDAFSIERVQPHIHLPIQAGSDAMIRRIGRSYTHEGLLKSIDLLRTVKDDPFIAADMITGLPGETDKDFSRSLELVRNAEITRLHVFPYSPRPGTALYHAEDPVAEYVRDVRAAELRSLSADNHSRFTARQQGKVLWAVAEQQIDTGIKKYWSALTENYLHCRVPPDVSITKGSNFYVRLDLSGEFPAGVPVEVR